MKLKNLDIVLLVVPSVEIVIIHGEFLTGQCFIVLCGLIDYGLSVAFVVIGSLLKHWMQNEFRVYTLYT